MNWFDLIKKYLSEPVAIAIMVFIFACIFISQVPKWIVTMETFAGEKQCIYQSIQKGDYWQEIRSIEMEMRSLQQQKWQIEDRIDKNQASVRDIRRLEIIDKQILNLEKRKIQIMDYVKGYK